MGKWLKIIAAPGEAPEGHISDEDMALAAEGRVSADRKESIFAHLNRCSACLETLSNVVRDMETDQVRQKIPVRMPRRIYAVAASIVLIAAVGFFFKDYWMESQTLVAEIDLDVPIRSVLLESNETVWQGEKVNRLMTLLHERGIRAKIPDKIILLKPYQPVKSLFGSEEVLHIQLEKGVMYLEVRSKE